MLRIVLPAISTVLAISLVLALVLKGSPSHTRLPGGNFDGAPLPVGVLAQDFALDDQHGRRVSLNAYRGKVVVLVFLSPSCRSCLLVAQQVRGALDELGKANVQTIFVSTDPSTPRARLERFLAETSLSGRVEYLTGVEKELRPLRHAYRLPPAGAGKTVSEAAITVLLIDRRGFERVAFGLEQITPEGLAHDIRLLQSS